MHTLRGRPGQPEFSIWRTRTWGCSRASASRRAPVPSVEPSSTKITSCSSRARVWPSRLSRHSSTWGPGSKTGTITLTFADRSLVWPHMPPGDLEPLIERLEHAAAQLRGGELSGERAASVVDECARLAAEASAQL